MSVDNIAAADSTSGVAMDEAPAGEEQQDEAATIDENEPDSSTGEPAALEKSQETKKRGKYWILNQHIEESGAPEHESASVRRSTRLKQRSHTPPDVPVHTRKKKPKGPLSISDESPGTCGGDDTGSGRAMGSPNNSIDDDDASGASLSSAPDAQQQIISTSCVVNVPETPPPAVSVAEAMRIKLPKKKQILCDLQGKTPDSDPPAPFFPEFPKPNRQESFPPSPTPTPPRPFTTPSPAPTDSGMKLKSRWLIKHHDPVPEPVPQTTEPLDTSTDVVSELDASLDSVFDATVNPNDPTTWPPIPEFEMLTENQFFTERRRLTNRKEKGKLLCDCTWSPDDEYMGKVACGADCINRNLHIECGSKCACYNFCTNKRFQNKEYADVEPFPAGKKGWGLRAKSLIPNGAFIMEYLGEVISGHEFKSRLKDYTRTGRDRHAFFLALNTNAIMDSTNKGNHTRFLNHSCDPNAETQKWNVNGYLRIGFFATKDIQPMEEITFDYKYQRFGSKNEKCFCASAKCCGYIGGEAEVFELLPTPEKDSPDKVQVSPVGVVKAADGHGQSSAVQRLTFRDLQLEQQVEKLTSRGKLISKRVAECARLMLRADVPPLRHALLDLVEKSSTDIIKSFMDDAQLLYILHQWLIEEDKTDPVDRFALRLRVLQLLEKVPIMKKNQLKESRLDQLVNVWLLETEPESEKQGDPISDAVENLVKHVCVESGEKPGKSAQEMVQETKAEIKCACQRLAQQWEQLRDVYKIPKKSQSQRASAIVTPQPQPVQQQPPEEDEWWKKFAPPAPESERTDPRAVRKELTMYPERKRNPEYDTSASSRPHRTEERYWDDRREDSYSGYSSGSYRDRRDDYRRRPYQDSYRRDDGRRDDSRDSYRRERDSDRYGTRWNSPEPDRKRRSDDDNSRRSGRSDRRREPECSKKNVDDRRREYEEQEDIYAKEFEQIELSAKLELEEQQTRDGALPVFGSPTSGPKRSRFSSTPGGSQPSSQITVTPPMVTPTARITGTVQPHVPQGRLAPPVLGAPAAKPAPPDVAPTQTAGPALGGVSAAQASAYASQSQNMAFPALLVFDPNTKKHWWQDQTCKSLVYSATDDQVHKYLAGDMSGVPFFYYDAAQSLIREINCVNLPASEARNAANHQALSYMGAHSDRTFQASAPVQQTQQAGVPAPTAYASSVVMPPPAVAQVPATAQPSQPPPSSSEDVAALKKQVADLERQLKKKKDTSRERKTTPKPVKKPQTDKLPPNWRSAIDEDGDTYYYHVISKKTQWEHPSRTQGNETESEVGPPEKKSRTVAADTSSEVDQKKREEFKKRVSHVVLKYLTPYRKPDCTTGRIASSDDFKHLARKLTHAIFDKERKKLESDNELRFNENVAHRTKEYVKRVMAKMGPVFVRE